MSSRFLAFRLTVLMVVLLLPFSALAADDVGQIKGNGSMIEWSLARTGHESITLIVQGPDGRVYENTFRGHQNPAFRTSDLKGALLDGVYTYELRVNPAVSDGVKAALKAARAAGDDAKIKEIMKANGLLSPVVQSGAFGMLNGAFLDPTAKEPTAKDNQASRSAQPGGVTTTASRGPGSISVNDQVIPDDLIVQMSLCVGFDCVDGESFGFDTIRLKENNTQINFTDTSALAGYPTNDWTFVANDANSGGLSYLAFNDVTAGRKPFLVEAAAPANALYVDSTGNVGLQTSTPVLDLHLSTTDTPAIRLEQTNAGGWTAQTWDIGANEANFFVRDLTGGSKLSLRIRPGAPTSSLDIAADGNVGMGTSGPVANLDVRGDNAHLLVGTGGTTTTDFLGPTQTGFGAQNGAERLLFGVQSGLAFLGSNSNTNLGFITNNTTKVTITGTGNLGIGNTAPSSQLVITSGATSSSINAGATQFSVTSSRELKDNIVAFALPDILSRIEKVPVVTYDFRNDGPKDVMGLVAEEFHTVFHRGDEKSVDGHEVQMALWMAVQQLTRENKALLERIESLEKQIPASVDNHQ